MKNKKFITLGIVAAALVVSVSAGPTLEKVMTYYNPFIQYTLDGQPILEGQGAIVYKDSTYVPVRAITEAIGLDVTYENGVVQMSKSNKEKEDSQTPTIKDFDYEAMVITEVREEGTSFVMKDKDETDEAFFVVVHAAEDVHVSHHKNKMAYQFKDLQVGQIVSVKTTGMAMTSLPTQVVATQIVLLDKEIEPKPPTETVVDINDLDYKEMAIVKIDFNRGKLVMAPQGSDSTVLENLVVVNLNDSTSVAHYLNKKMYYLEDLKEGLAINVKSTGASTMSLPPQITATQILLMD